MDRKRCVGTDVSECNYRARNRKYIIIKYFIVIVYYY